MELWGPVPAVQGSNDCGNYRDDGSTNDVRSFYSDSADSGRADSQGERSFVASSLSPAPGSSRSSLIAAEGTNGRRKSGDRSDY